VVVATLTRSLCQLEVHGAGRAAPAETLSGTLVQPLLDRPQVRGRVPAQVTPLGEVLAEQPVGVFIRAAPAAARRDSPTVCTACLSVIRLA
jgi:hypothetical protein